MSISGMGLELGGVGGVPSSAAAVFGSIAMDGDEYVRCTRCGYGGCDVRVAGCGCTLHARCVALKLDGPLTACPQCERHSHGLVLFPMSFREIDEAKKTMAALASTGRRGRKRKSSDSISAAEEKGAYVAERRTGRWTTEEMAYCDKLIEKFRSGHLPIVNGIKLNDFLGNMLKSKQSRLTKKMKNAKLSSKTFERSTGCIPSANEAREFSELEDSFFHSVQCHQERAEIKFHMQREWRELFSNFCVSIGQPLDADAWLSSVEEMDRRASHARDAARMARRKVMMGFALRTDTKNPDQGVFIEKTDAERIASEVSGNASLMSVDNTDTEEMLALLADKSVVETKSVLDTNGKSSLLHSAPFLSKAISYMQRHNVPFEHVDLWVPSFVPNADAPSEMSGSTTCRLCYAGSATVDFQIGPDGKCNVPLSGEEQFNLYAFGDYSQKFSFDVGCGLPGRVYQNGLPTWEQSVHNAPHHHFERCGGALQWGIKTVVGIPVASPNVGRIVVVLYSRNDRDKDQELVGRLSEEFTRLMPSPKWKLVVDIGEPEPSNATMPAVSVSMGATNTVVPAPQDNSAQEKVPAESNLMGNTGPHGHPPRAKDHRVDEVVSLLGEYMPSDPTSPMASYLPGYMSLRLLLLRPSRTAEDEELVRTMLGSYSSYTAGGRAKGDIANLLARDFMFLTQQQPPQQQPFLGYGQGLTSQASSAPAMGYTQHAMPPPVPPKSVPFQNSPALSPIPFPSSGLDSVSIVST